MKNKLLFLIIFTCSLPARATTWYVRSDGGTRYSTNVLTGQCDGMSDVPATTSVVNGHCAFKDYRLLFQDGSYNTAASFPAWGWVIAGGDTVIVRGSIAAGVSYRIGWDGPVYSGFGIAGDSIDSGMPPPPSGTATQHTRILGENWQACRAPGAKTQLHGGWGAFNVVDLHGVSYVDMACFDITDFSACGRATQKVGCDASQDFSQVGVKFSSTSTNDTLTDVHIHGLAGSGIFGPTGDGVALKYVDVVGNASSGWNADANDGTTGVGSLLVQNYNIIGNGCAEQYPLTWPAAKSIGDCTDQGSGGYGDGFGTATANSPAPGWRVHFDQGTVAYNTQDGLDALHIGGPGSTMSITGTLAYGNEGEQLKVGGATASIQDSVIVGNCFAMSPGNLIPGFTTNAFSVLNTLCRSGNVAALINVTPNDPAVFQNNTIFTMGSIGLEVEYALGVTDPANTLKYNNNLFFGFYNNGNQAYPTPIYSSTDLNFLTNPGASWTNNAYYGFRNNWPCPHPGETAAICSDPGLMDETYHLLGYGNMAPASQSIVAGAGIAIPSILFDITGVAMPSPAMIGAIAQGRVLPGFDPPNAVVLPPPPPPPPTTGWFSPTPQVIDGNVLTFTSTVTVQYGQDASTCVATYQTCVSGQPSPANWLPAVAITGTQATPATITVGALWAGSDPNPGVYKQLKFKQIATDQTVGLVSGGVSSTLVIPALAGPVIPVVPIITWTPAPLVVTSALSALQLNAVASTPGVFTYSPSPGKFLALGGFTLSTTFVPTDTTHFKTTTKTVVLSVIAPPVPTPVVITCTSSLVAGKLSVVCK